VVREPRKLPGPGQPILILINHSMYSVMLAAPCQAQASEAMFQFHFEDGAEHTLFGARPGTASPFPKCNCQTPFYFMESLLLISVLVIPRISLFSSLFSIFFSSFLLALPPLPSSSFLLPRPRLDCECRCPTDDCDLHPTFGTRV